MVQIAILGDVEGLPLLGSWLQLDPALDRSVIHVVRAPIPEGTLGAVTDTLQVVLGSGSILPALAASISTWAISRRRKMTIAINGISVSVDGSRDADKLALEIVEKLMAGPERTEGKGE